MRSPKYKKRKTVQPFPEALNVKFKRTKQSGETLSLAKEKLAQRPSREVISLLQRTEDYEPEATFLLGVIYFDGLGVPSDAVRGIEYMQKMCTMNGLLPHEENLQSEALYNLGLEYYQGRNVPKDDDLAIRYWKKAAKMNPDSTTGQPHSGAMKAQSSLGMLYSSSDHHDMEKSFYWHNKACRNGSVESEGALGVMFLTGLGTEIDPIRAYSHLLDASMKGNVYAQGYLTSFYYMRQMYHRAIDMGKLLSEYGDPRELAANGMTSIQNVQQGIALGCYYLALCYQYGYGAENKDLEAAKALIYRTVQLYPTMAFDLHVKAILGIN